MTASFRDSVSMVICKRSLGSPAFASLVLLSFDLSCYKEFFAFWLQGSGIHTSEVMQGMVFKREVEGDLKKVENCKLAVYTCPLDIMQTETKVVTRTCIF